MVLVHREIYELIFYITLLINISPFSINLLDHLIITTDRCFYSFADEGLI